MAQERQPTGALGLARATIRKKETPFREEVERRKGNLLETVLYLVDNHLELSDEVEDVTTVISFDGYSTGTSSSTARVRLAVGLDTGTSATPLLTVADKEKCEFVSYFAFEFPEQLRGIQRGRVQKGTLTFPLRVLRITGDHAELTSLFEGIHPSSSSFRSAFCNTHMDKWVSDLRVCASLQKSHDTRARRVRLSLHARKFVCPSSIYRHPSSP